MVASRIIAEVDLDTANFDDKVETWIFTNLGISQSIARLMLDPNNVLPVKATEINVYENAQTSVSISTVLVGPLTVFKYRGDPNISFTSSGNDIIVNLITPLVPLQTQTAAVRVVQANGLGFMLHVALNAVPNTSPIINLNSLGLTGTTIFENSVPGTFIGTVVGKTPGSTITLSETTSGAFALSGNDVVAGTTPINFEVPQAYSVTIREELAGAQNSPRETLVVITILNVNEQPSLNQLSGTFNLLETAVQGALAGAVTGKTAGSTLTLIDNAGGRVALSGTNIIRGAVALNYSTGVSHNFIIRETLGDSPNSPRDTVLTLNVVNVNEEPPLSALTLTTNIASSGVFVAINILGATAGSTITGTMPPGLTLNSASRVISGIPTTKGSYNFILTETLGDSPNSPRNSNASVLVTDRYRLDLTNPINAKYAATVLL